MRPYESRRRDSCHYVGRADFRGQESDLMPEALPILALSVVFGLYAIHELAPDALARAAGRLRRSIRMSPGGAGLRSTIRAVIQAQSSRDVRAMPATATVAGSAASTWLDSRALILWAPLAIVALAFALRVYQVTYSPYGFFCDEASNALDAYYLLTTLHDQHGAFLPAYFQALGEWKGGFHIYWDVPFVALFGLSELAVRMGAATEGTVTAWLTYLFVSKAINRPVALISALLLATSPWHIMASRVGINEVTSLPLITALMLTFLYLGMQRPRLLGLVFVSAALGVYAYFAGRLFFPVLLIIVLIIYAPVFLKYWRECIPGGIAAGVVMIPTAMAVANGTFFTHFNQVTSMPQSLSGKLAMFWGNYQLYLGPSFLFQTTDAIYRHYVRGFGLIYPILAPFIVIGLVAMIARLRRAYVLLLALLALYPVPGALASAPYLPRAISGVLVFQIIAAIGIYVTLRGIVWAATQLAGLTSSGRARNALMGTLAGLLLVVNLGAAAGFMQALLVDYPTYASGWLGWQWGARQIVAYFEAHGHEYNQQLMDAEFNAPDELLRFYTTPDTGQCATCTITNVADPAVVKATYISSERQLWAVGPDVLQSSSLDLLPHRVVGKLTYPGGQTAFLFIATGPRTQTG